MKKFLQVSVIVVFALALLCAAFTVTATGAGLTAGKICPKVGWNNGVVRCSTPAAGLQGLAFQIIILPPGPMPNVGWNS